MSTTEISVAAWTLTSYCVHVATTTFLQHGERLPFGVSGEFLALIVTLVQLGLGILLVRVTVGEECVSDKLVITALAGHILGTYTNNYLYISNCEHLALALAMRLFEPITTAVTSCLIEKRTTSAAVGISVMVLTASSLLLLGADIQFLLASKQLLLIVFMNFCHSVRNIAVKDFKKFDIEIEQRSPIISASTLGFYLLIILREYASPTHSMFSYPLVLLLTTAILHVAVTFLSTSVVLKSMSVTTHAVLGNVVRNVAIILTLVQKGTQNVTAATVTGAALFLLAAGIYAKHNHRQQHEETFGLKFHSAERLLRVNRVSLMCLMSSGILYGADLLRSTVATFIKTADNTIHV